MILINIRPRFYYQTSFFLYQAQLEANLKLCYDIFIHDISHFLHQTEQLIDHKINNKTEWNTM